MMKLIMIFTPIPVIIRAALSTGTSTGPGGPESFWTGPLNGKAG